jgi:hypothetical protein
MANHPSRPTRAHRRFLPATDALEGRRLFAVGFLRPQAFVPRDATEAVVEVRRSGPTAAAPVDASAAETVTLVTTPGTARTGVDFTPTRLTVTLAPGEASKQVRVPIGRVGTPSGVQHTIRLAVEQALPPNTQAPLPTQMTVNVMPTNDATPPRVTSARAVFVGRKVGSFQLTFSEDMDPGAVAEAKRYMIVDPNRGAGSGLDAAEPGRLPPWLVKVRSATYDAATRTLTLVPRKAIRRGPDDFAVVSAVRPRADGSFRIVPPPTDLAANPIDSDGDLVADAALNAVGIPGGSNAPRQPVNSPPRGLQLITERRTM